MAYQAKYTAQKEVQCCELSLLLLPLSVADSPGEPSHRILHIWMQFSMWGLTRAGSPPLTTWTSFWYDPGYCWHSGLWGHITGSCPACHPHVPPGPFWQDYTQPFQASAYICNGGCLDPDTRLRTWICWTSEIHLSPMLVSVALY